MQGEPSIFAARIGLQTKRMPEVTPGALHTTVARVLPHHKIT